MIPELFFQSPPDISALEQKQDIRGLIRALTTKKPEVQMLAAEALARIGTPATPALIDALKTRNRVLRLGVISALADIQDPRALQALEETTRDPNNEIRWQACTALGEMGDIRAAPALLVTLRDRDKYVRYASARSLQQVGYIPVTEEEQAFCLAGMQEWEKLAGLRSAALPAVTTLLTDSDPIVRRQAVRTLGVIGSRQAEPALIRSLGDDDRQVRWEAVLASQKCGIPPMLLPRGLCRRPRQKKSPLIAGFLNFILPGTGYGYLGKWWGVIIFQIDITATVWLYKYSGEANTYSILFPFYILFAVHAWYITKMMPEDPP